MMPCSVVRCCGNARTLASGLGDDEDECMWTARGQA